MDGVYMPGVDRVSLAIVWGTTLERMRFVAYLIFAVVFAAGIYPIVSHQLFGGGWLQTTIEAQDFAGSTVVHLTGATAGLAALLLLGPRIGKYGRDRKPNLISGHSMPIVGLGILILWLGWFGFNPGSTLGALGNRFADVALVPIIGVIAGALVVVSIIAIEKVLDDPVGAISAHGIAGIWGTLACGLFTSERLAELNGVGEGGLWYTGSFAQLWAQFVAVGLAFAFVFLTSIAVFALIKYTLGIRITPEQEKKGLDISEHGMYGYPEHMADF